MLKYCTYITFYYGKLLPPFYIGSSYVNNIINNSYRGSVSSKAFKQIWIDEIKNNPHLFKTKIISYHKTRKEATEKERKFHLTLNVVNNPLYLNKSIASLNMFPYDRKGYKHTAETKLKISKGNKGKRRSQEFKDNVSKTQKGHRSYRKPHSRDVIEKIANSNRGKKRTGKALENIRKATQSESFRAKMRKHNANNTRSAKKWQISQSTQIYNITNLKQWCRETFHNKWNAAYSSFTSKGYYKNYSAFTI